MSFHVEWAQGIEIDYDSSDGRRGMVESDANTLNAVSSDGNVLLPPLARRDVREIRDEAIRILGERERRSDGIGKIDFDGYFVRVGDDTNVVDQCLRS
jgi:hypothetical protein